MRSAVIKILSFILSIIIIFSFTAPRVTYAVEIPQYVRIGLFFNYNYIKSAVDSFNISAEKGIEAGWYGSGGTFNALYTSSDNSVIQVKKDSRYYFMFSNGITNSSGAQAKADEIRAAGINAFPSLNSTNNWVVLIGGYPDKTSADADKTTNLDKKLTGLQLTQVAPSSRMVTASNAAGQTVFGIYSDSVNLTLRPASANELKVVKLNSKAYRGELEVIRQQGSDMTVVNVVGLEQYLYGVVPSEIWGATEALKAQAVAARNYTINNLNKYSSLGFNLCNTTNSQVYGGFSSEVLATNKAVDATSGQLVIYNGKPAAAFYFSSSGGMTEDVKNVWGSTDYPYLVSVEDKYELPTATSNYTWTKTFTAEQIKSRVSKDIGDVTGLEVTKKSAAGRVTELVIKGTKAQAVYTLEGTRNILSLPSQWYTIDSGSGSGAGVSVGVSGSSAEKNPSSLKIMTANGLVDAPSGGISVIGGDGTVKSYSAVASTPGTFTVSGRGYGHAIGMSQNGTMGMAKAGFTYKEILQHYFTGAVVQ